MHIYTYIYTYISQTYTYIYIHTYSYIHTHTHVPGLVVPRLSDETKAMPREKGQIFFFVGIFHNCLGAPWLQRYRSERERERERESERERERERVCVCVCVRERERKKEERWREGGRGKEGGRNSVIFCCWNVSRLECVRPACLPRCPISTVL